MYLEEDLLSKQKDKKKIKKTVRKYAGSNFLKHACRTHRLPDLPVPSTIRKYLAEQERLLAVATARRESPRPNATTTVCDTLGDQAIRRLSKRVREAINVSVTAANACASHDLFGDVPAQTNVLRIKRLKTLH